jgi:hypothetical protein
VRRAFEHLVSPAGLIEPQHFADFTLKRPHVEHLANHCQSLRRYLNEEEDGSDTVVLGFFLRGLGC